MRLVWQKRFNESSCSDRSEDVVDSYEEVDKTELGISDLYE